MVPKSIADKLLSIGAVLAIPMLLVGLWQASTGIRRAILEQIQARHRHSLVDSLVANDTDRPFLGADTGTVVLLEFLDYQCPGCRAGDPVIKSALEQSPNVKLLVFQEPLESIHPGARMAALLAICAAKAGLFEEVHPLLIGIADFTDTASVVRRLSAIQGLDSDRIAACTREPDTEIRLRMDQTYAERMGVDGTPTFVDRDGRIINLPRALKLIQEAPTPSN